MLAVTVNLTVDEPTAEQKCAVEELMNQKRYESQRSSLEKNGIWYTYVREPLLKLQDTTKVNTCTGTNYLLCSFTYTTSRNIYICNGCMHVCTYVMQDPKL